MTAAGYDFVILHPGHCGCVSEGWVSDSMWADQQCQICDESFGLNVPVTVGERRLGSHLSCYLEREERP